MDAIVVEKSARRDEVTQVQDLLNGKAGKKHDLRTDGEVMQFTHFSVKEFLSSPLRLE